MPEGNGLSRDARPGDGDRNRFLAKLLRQLFGRGEGDLSLRAQLEEAIDEHEGDTAVDGGAPGDLSPLERDMLRNLLHFSEHDADDVAIPRGEIIAVPASASFAELVAAFAEHGHSRMPVYRETLDDVIGMVHIKDVFALVAGNDPPPADWSGLMRQPLFVPQARGALDVLADMRASRTHLAVVVDEYSGTDGIITIEDLVEEIVGDIEDEHDDEPERMLLLLEPGLWDADGRAELDDVAAEIDPRLADVEGDVDTLGGLAVILAGHVPAVGECLAHGSGWTLEITGATERNVTRLRLHAPGPESNDG